MKITSQVAGIIAGIFISSTAYATACAVQPNVWSNNPESVTDKFKDKVSSLLFKSAQLKEANGEMGPVAIYETITLTPEKGSGGNLKFMTSNHASTITFVPVSATSSLMDTEFNPLTGVLKVYQIQGKAKITGVLSHAFANKGFPAQLILIGKGNQCEVVLSKWIFSIKIPKEDINTMEIVKQNPNADTSSVSRIPADGILLESSGEFVSGAKLEAGF
jgi:hypothetical protein